MGKRTIAIILAAGVLALLSFSVPAYALQDIISNTPDDGETETTAPTRAATRTCAFEELDFEDYHAIIKQMTETIEYPHFLEENAQRYDAFQAANPSLTRDRVIALVNVNVDKEAFSDIQDVPDPNDIFVLVNKHFRLPSNWSPDDFVDVGGRHMMREEAAEHFMQMREAMREEGLTLNIVITYRSYTSQRNHFGNFVARFGQRGAEGGIARPGHSEHQTGLSLDVLHRGHDGGYMMNMGFDNSKQYEWLVENAYNYGFILRYPREDRAHHGFVFEPWHWRYVGIPIATVMHNEETPTYEEFYGRYLVQGIRDNVNEFIIEQERLAAEAAAQAERDAIAAAEAAAIAEQEAIAAEIAAREATEAAAKEALKASALTASVNASAEIHTIITAKTESFSPGRHFIEIIAVAIIAALAAIYFTKKRKMNRHM